MGWDDDCKRWGDDPADHRALDAWLTRSDEEVWGDVIDRYSRADAIADGVLVDATDAARELGIALPAARDWFRKAEKLWNEHRSSKNLTLIERLDFQRGLSNQFPKLTPRVVYNASGMYLAAAVVEEPAVFEHTLYWCTPSTPDEAHYLAAVLNSDVLTKRLRPLQARGEHNPRHYDKYVWNIAVPRFDPSNAHHAELARLGLAAKTLADAVQLPERTRFEVMRGTIRRAVGESDVGRDIERAVAALLPPSA